MSTPEEQARTPMVWTVDHRPGAKEDKVQGEAKIRVAVEPDLTGLEKLTDAVRELADAIRKANGILSGMVAEQPDTAGQEPEETPTWPCPEAENGFIHTSHVWRYFLKPAFCEGYPAEEIGVCPLLADGKSHAAHGWSVRPGTHESCPGVMQLADGQDRDSLPVRPCPVSGREGEHPGHAWLPLEDVRPAQMSGCPGWPLPRIPDPVGCPLWNIGEEHGEHHYGPPGNTCPGA